MILFMEFNEPLCNIGDEVLIRCGYRYILANVVKIDNSTPIIRYYTNLNNNERYFTADDIKENMVFFKNK